MRRTGRPFLEYMDQRTLDNRYSNEHKALPLLPREGFGISTDKLEEAVRRLPHRYRGIIRAIYVEQVGVAQIAALLGCTDRDIQYLHSKAKRALLFVLQLPKINQNEMEADLRTILTAEQTDIVLNYVETFSQTLAAKRLGISQGKLKYQLEKAKQTLLEHSSNDSNLVLYLDVIREIEANAGLLQDRMRKSK